MLWSHTDRARRATRSTLILVALAAAASETQAQYFGRNKVQYDRLDFRIAPTEHFDIHFYPSESLATADAARMAERWYQRHSALLKHTFTRNPLIFYADPPDFHQSNVIEGMIGQGTGGVTEGLRERVIMPFTGVYSETDHVLGHELVHVFQYRIAEASRTSSRSLNAVPLWVIEGMAEYLSLGRDDPNTAMWLRDALRRNDLPSIDDLSGGKYFPYRYGQAVWAYIGGAWGDSTVNLLFRAALRSEWNAAVKSVLGVTSDSLSKLWHAAIRAQYADVSRRIAPNRTGRQLIASDENEQNVSPTLSPDGKQVAFFSSRGLFDIDLYVADAATGRVVKRLTSVERDRHFEALSFISTAGTWSPDARKLAFVVYADGNSAIQIVDARSGDAERRISPPGIGAISDPAWSPDGKTIAFSGQRGGISDLYLFDLATGRTRQLTNDRDAQVHPAWSPDGTTLAFATDRGDKTDFAQLSFGPLRLAVMNIASGDIRLLPPGRHGKQINPQFSADGASIYYISDDDGVSDIYRMALAGGETRRVTNVATGISGITALSPALSVARSNGDVVFSVFDQQGFAIRAIAGQDAAGTVIAGEPSPPQTGAGVPPTAGMLPPSSAFAGGVVEQALRTPSGGLPAQQPLRAQRYHSGLSLDQVGGPTVGVVVGGPQGAAVGGGIGLGFSDMLGNHVVYGMVNAPGNVRDIGADALYLNRERRLTWGVELYHLPIASVFATADPATLDIDGDPVAGVIYTQQLDRTYFNNAQLITQYPLSTTRRFEVTAGVQHIGFGTEVDSLYVVGNTIVRETNNNFGAGEGITLGTAAAAFVHDNSFFAFTGPVAGSRYRLEAAPYFGSLNYQTLLADYRHYFFARPLTLAVRGLHFGRFGGDSESDRLRPIFLGQPTLVRGYDAASFDVSECTATDTGDDCPQFSRLVGSRVAVASAELRIPLFGTDQLGLFTVPFLPIEIAPFIDAGVAWTSNQSATIRFDRSTADRVPVFSTGVSARLNLLGAAIVELYWVHPYQRPGKGSFFGFQLMPGW